MSSQPLPGNLSLGTLLGDFADGLSDIVYRRRIWPDSAFEYVNEAVTRVSGYTPAELYADPDLAARIVHPDEFARLRHMLDTAADASMDYMVRWVRKDGGLRHVQHRSRIIRDETGRPVAVEGIARDVTAEVDAAAVRRHQELLDLASDSIFTWDADSHLTSWNKGAARLYGWAATEVMGKNVHELLCTRFPAPPDEIMASFLADGHWEGRLVQTTRSGEQVTVESRWALQRGADGAVIGNLAINHDITERRRLERELLESERKYRDIYDNSPDMYFLGMPTEHRIVDCNQTLLRTLGYTKDEITTDPTSILFEPSSFARIAELVPQLERTHLIENIEVQLKCKDGALVDTLMSVRLESDPVGGSPIGRVSLRNITERKRADAEQRLLTERLQLAMEVASIGVWDSARQGEGMVWDARMCAIHGIEPQTQVTYERWLNLIHPEDAPFLIDALNASLADGKPRAVEYRVVLPDGSIRHIQAMGKAVPDAEGRLLRQIGVCMDITERKAREQERGFLAAIVESSPDAIVGGNLDGTILSWNAGAERLYGYTAAEAIGQHFTMLARPADRRHMKHMLAQLTNEKKAVFREMPRLTKDGRIVEVAVTAAPVFDEQGRIVGVSSISHDITERKRLERELQESEERFRLMADILPVPEVLVRASDQVLLYANPAFAELAGLVRAELIGRQAALFHVAPDNCAAILEKTMQEGAVHNLEIEYQRPDGRTFYGLYSAARGTYHGEPVILALALDITEHKKAEAARAESEAQLRAIVENTGDLIWSIDRDYRLLVGNSAFGQRIVMSVGHALSAGESVFDTPYPSTNKALWKSLYDRVLAGEAIHFQAESVLHPGIVLECFLNPIRTASGDVTGVACRSVDITERLRSEEKMHETTQRLKLAADAARIGVWTWNYADGSLEWDDQMCELYAVSNEMRAAGLFYDVWRSHVHPNDLAEAEASLNEAIRLNREWKVRYRVILPGGITRYIQAASIPEYDRHGKPSRMIGINRDVTEQALHEQVLEQRVHERTAELVAALEKVKTADRLKDEFLASVSHELRTPLNGILGAAELLSMQLFGPVNERQQRQLNAIRDSGERLLKMLNALLRYAGLTAGKAMLRREYCSLGEVAIACISKASRAAAARHVEVVYQIPSPAPVILSDAQAVTELLDELLDNAVKFTPEGGHIGLEVGETDVGVQLVVWDTGIGIAPDKLETMFLPFVQGEGGLARRYEGIGLGLPFAARMADALGGSIAVESEVGKGSRFTVLLPNEYATGRG